MEPTETPYLPPHYAQKMAELTKGFLDVAFPGVNKLDEKLPQVARLHEGEHVSYVLGEIQQEALRVLQDGGTIRGVLATHSPHAIVREIKNHTIATNREGGFGRSELLRSMQTQITTGGPPPKRGFLSRLVHPFRRAPP